MKGLTTPTMALIFAIVFMAPVAGAAAQAELPEGAGRAIVEGTCTTCHGTELITGKQASRDDWLATIENMRAYGASVDDASIDPLADYLSTHFGLAAGDEVVLDALPAANPDYPVNPNYEVDIAWARLPDGMTWDNSTSSIAADGNGLIVVLVRTAPFFRAFNRDGEFVRAWGDDPDLFMLAHSVAFDHEGFIWATDSNGHAVHKFSPDGDVVMTLGHQGAAGDNGSHYLFNRPNAVAVTPNGDIYVSDGYVNSRIVHYSPDGEFLRGIGGLIGDAPGHLTLPHGVVVDSNGRIIVADSDNQRISVFGADGKFVEHWPVPSRGGMVIDDNDTVYVTDVDANAIHVLRDGEVLEVIGGLGRVHGLTRDSDGALYAADSANRRVMKITPR